MAKAARRRKRTTRATTAGIEAKVVRYAEERGRLLGTARARVEVMGVERRRAVQRLSSVVKDAQTLLTELGQNAAKRVTSLTRGRKPASNRIPKHMAGGPDAKKHRLPATTRQKMARRRVERAKA